MMKAWRWALAMIAPAALFIVVPAGADVAADSKTLSAQAGDLCPIVRTSCAADADAGSQAPYSVIVAGGDMGAIPTYNWTVSEGMISAGQGTRSILVDTTGTEGRSITATVEVGGFPRHCSTASSCTLQVAARAMPATKFGEYVTADLTANKLELGRWIAALQRDPAAQGYLIAYGGRSSRPGDAMTAAHNATDYTMNVLKMDGARTLSGDGGYRERPTIELWISPPGGAVPMATPTVSSPDVTPKP